MAQICGFFDAKLVNDEFDRVYVADQFAAYFRSFIGNGIFNNYGADILTVQENNPKSMSVVVTPGQGWINGYWYKNTEDIELNLDIADGTRNRIDSIVLRWDKTLRDMYVTVLKGELAINPVAPEPVRTTEYFDLLLATVSIKAGTINIGNKDITDTRMDNEVCGWVTAVVDQVDTTTLYQQFQDYFENFVTVIAQDFLEWSTEQKEQFIEWSQEQKDSFELFFSTSEEEFNNWFNTIRGILDEEAAGHIINLIDKLRLSICENFSSDKTYASGDYAYYNDILYRFNKNHFGPWDENDVDETNVTDELKKTGMGARLEITVPENSTTTITIEETGDEFTYVDETHITQIIYTYGTVRISVTDGEKSAETIIEVLSSAVYRVQLNYYGGKIKVNYPEGSTCTCEKGTVVLTAKDTSGTYTFDLLEGGSWTVRITDGTRVVSQIVNVLEEKVYETTLSYFSGKIRANYPVGATCTCTKDETILEATETPFIFDLPEAGIWTVKIIQEGEHDVSQNVNVTQEIMYDVTLAFFSSTINVNYPSGSTCTITGTQGNVYNAPDTSGVWACRVKEADTYIVKCELGSKSTQKSAVITATGQTQSVKLNFYRTMTVRIDLNNSNPRSCCTYEDDAVDMVPGSSEWDEFFGHYPVMLKDGIEGKKLDPNDFTKHLDGTPADIISGDEGDVMICFPRRRISVSAGISEIVFKMTDDPDFWDPGFPDNAFKFSGVSHDRFYLGAYKSTYSDSSVSYSVSGQLPSTSFITGQRSNAKKKMPETATQEHGYRIMTIDQLLYIQCMYVLKYKNLDSQSAVGRGITGTAQDVKTGRLDKAGMDYGDKYNTYTQSMKLFGLEDLWGEHLEAIDGCQIYPKTRYSNDMNIYILKDAARTENIQNDYEVYQSTISNVGKAYIQRMSLFNRAFLPVLTTGGSASSSTYFCDTGNIIANADDGYSIILLGGGNNAREAGGIFCIWSGTLNYTLCSSRLLYI